MAQYQTENEPKNPIKNLESLRQLLDGAEEVTVDQSGSIHGANDPKIAGKSPQERTVVKPQRWF